MTKITNKPINYISNISKLLMSSILCRVCWDCVPVRVGEIDTCVCKVIVSSEELRLLVLDPMILIKRFIYSEEGCGGGGGWNTR